MLCAMRVAPLGTVVAGLVLQRDRRPSATQAEQVRRFQELPTRLAMQKFQPVVPYPGWDDNWDYCDLDQKAIAKRLKHTWPITDYPKTIHQLYAEHTDRPTSKVDKLIEANVDDLPGLYKRAFLRYAYGGAVTRHILLVRHGQYEEHRELSQRLHSENPHMFGLPGDAKFAELDKERVLTALGREQALKVGDRLAELLRPALTTPGRESHVRIHASTLARAQETADHIASRLPPHVRRLEPNPMLVEGEPPAHIIPYAERGGEEFICDRARDVHIEGARMEAAFRSLFYRDLPCRPAAKSAPKEVTEVNASSDKRTRSHHEYEIVVCHMNLIRYFTLRALQLPPEAWLRLGGDNGSITHLKIRPSGTVSLQ
eukprot:CAMPEP_0171066048 /NCGR_PEP_ID=MMETSP0766_2-20121228/7198_1 /TAXON_ID=439317 /ORGANISM="Gambierdiscus australes, Strain CAWD 149" /LENGTH=370 /DNA_ID=CAMNT_0011522199 /DNA_START=45 /DNA_END=1154 /DNA_ORIENTATION=+